ncbi:terminase gpA endonuclease subunit [Sphingomonas sp. CROZ-RG-20F-R02-07]|uniref:phage terminase large subunit family protein n=1 Tax=Sphingomonas sp. CROZ-RG-20F-R02-07 TaxID=2914832 RepID=UPI001F572F40|nr:terminase gpA endonuclease subunit [Sphingomonas sp. CROZ-RG-20F-R02-07]
MTVFDYARFGSTAGDALRANARSLDRSMASGLRPPRRMKVSEWAATERRFADDDPIPGPWRHETAPELVEIMDSLSPEDPCEEASIIKCAQSGGSASAENWIGFISDLAPGPMLFVQGTLTAALAWAAEKFWPMVEATPKLNPARGGTIRAQGTPDGDGSTKGKIRFSRSNGFVLLAGATSAASLRQRTVRYAVEDDLDQYPDDVEGQGSPETMVDQRLKVWKRQGLSKRLKISTPLIKGTSKIGRAYAGSDRRRYHLKCPECGSRFVPEWSDVKWPDGQPEQAHLIPPCCGFDHIEHWQKATMKLPDGWLSDEIDGVKLARVMSEDEFLAARGRMPASVKRGFHLTGIISSFQTWADMAVGFIAAQGDLSKLKTWTNLVHGFEFELKGGTPDYEKLRELREQGWGPRQSAQMPIGPVVTTMGVDVQGDGLYLERVGWAENAESWVLDARFLPGATDVRGQGAWADLEAYARRKTRFPGGREFGIDQICVDAGYNTEAAEAFCRAHPNRLAVFGRAGWTLPILGRGENLRYEQQGRKAGQASKRAEDKAYIVGTFGVKLAWYGFLRETIAAAAVEREGAPMSARGRAHFNVDLPDDYFEQITAETIVTETVQNQPRRVWKPLAGRPNHWLDCRVYNTAAAEKLMLDTLTVADWVALRAERYAPSDDAQGDLLVMPIIARAAPAEVAPVAPAHPAPAAYIEHAEEWI